MAKQISWIGIAFKTQVKAHGRKNKKTGKVVQVREHNDARPQGKSDRLYYAPGDRSRAYKMTGEYRAPKAGEYFVSGAIPEVYRQAKDAPKGDRKRIAVQTGRIRMRGKDIAVDFPPRSNADGADNPEPFKPDAGGKPRIRLSQYKRYKPASRMPSNFYNEDGKPFYKPGSVF